MAPLSAPVLLAGFHELDEFACGEPSLDQWFRHRARRNMRMDATRVYVVCPKEEPKPIAFYGLSAASIAMSDVRGSMRRNMPDPIPCLLLGRLAVDTAWQGKGIASALLADCIERSLKLSDAAGIRLLLTHPLSDKVADFYRLHDFVDLPTANRTLGLDLNKVRKLKA